MTNKEIDTLVWMIYKGKNTYKDIKTKFPKLTRHEFIQMSVSLRDYGNIKKIIMMDRKVTVDQYYDGIKIDDNETFHLTVDGENILYRLQKEHAVNIREKRVFIMTAISTIAAVVSVIGAIKSIC